MTAATAETTEVKVTTSQTTAAPLGLMAFAVNIFLLAAPFAGIGSIPGTLAGMFAACGLTFGIAQMVAGFFEYRMGSGFLGLTFCSFGVFWMSTALFNVFQATGVTVYGENGADALKALGTWLLAWTLLVICLWIGSWFAGKIAFGIFTLLMAVLVVFIAGCYSSGDPTGTFKLGAWLAIATSLLTFYFAAALYLNEMTGKTLLPIR